MNLDYRDYLQGLVSFGSDFLHPIRCSKFASWYDGGFPNFAQRCSRAFRPVFLRLALGYEISVGAKRDSNLHISRQRLALCSDVSFLRV